MKSIKDSKKTCVIYGNCHMDNVYNALMNIKEFYEIYNIHYFFIADIKNVTAFLESQALKNCSLLISQYIQEKNSFGQEFSIKSVIEHTPKSCIKILIPNLYWLPRCFFPQAVKGGRIFEKKILFWGINFYEDELIENLLRSGEPLNVVIKAYDNLDTYNSKYLLDLYEEFIEKMTQRDEDLDVKVSDYAKNNFRNSRLFYDPGHPTEYLISYYVGEICSKLDINIDKDTCASYMRPCVGKEMPICASVVDVFELDKLQILPDGRKVDLLPGKKMNLKKYIYEYVGLRWTDRSLPAISRFRGLCIYGLMCLYAVPYSFIKFFNKYFLKK